MKEKIKKFFNGLLDVILILIPSAIVIYAILHFVFKLFLI
jgi:phosphotransferase system  glucose/maltose/N-acetylglucosamine-specific IIC component